MAKANCGGLVISSDTLITKNNIITTPDGDPTGGVKANCGGIQFDDTLFKKVGKVITDINAEPETVEAFIVNQPGCGGVLLDSNCFEFDENNNITFTGGTPRPCALTRSSIGCDIIVMRDGAYVVDGPESLNTGDEITISLVSGLFAVDYLKVNGVDFEDGGTMRVRGDVSITAKAHNVNYFKLIAVDSHITMSMQKVGSDPIPVSFEYYIAGSNWKDFTPDTTSIRVANVGDEVYFRAKKYNETLGTSRSYYKFNCSGEFKADGDIMSLLHKNLETTTVPDYGFTSLFANTNITEAANILTSTELGEGCYANMFENCRSLTVPPVLPADTLANNCYNSMFTGCASLTTVPILDAETLANGCYSSMFEGCIAITGMSELPARTLAPYCYESMFRRCTNLAAVNSLPATTLAEHCYDHMFEGCLGLTSSPRLSAETIPESAYESMFYACNNLVTAGDIDAFTYGKNACKNMFRGCDLLETAPTLKRASLDDGACEGMFAECGSLVTPPELSSTALGKNCYMGMFSGCKMLATMPELPATTLAEGCYSEMFSNCRSIATAQRLDALVVPNNAYSRMFMKCGSLTAVPTISALEVGESAFESMFEGCEVLNNVDILGATTLGKNCYRNMFKSCVSLTMPANLFATNLPEGCYQGMYDGCRGIKMSTTETGDYTTPYRIPRVDDGVDTTGTALSDMFNNTGGTFKGSPRINETYYLYDPIDPNNLFFKGTDTSSTISMEAVGHAPHISLEYKLNDAGWADFLVGTTVITLGSSSDKVYIRAKVDNSCMATSLDDYNHFIMTGSVTAGGDVLSLMRKGNEARTIREYGFARLFENCTALIIAPQISSQYLGEGAYYSMFEGCSNLVSATGTNGKEVGVMGCKNMFKNCALLVDTGEWSFVHVDDYAFESMFEGCSSIRDAGVDLAGIATLATGCYSKMFKDCTELMHTIHLPANALADSCYANMFDGCTALTGRTALPNLGATTLVNNCYKEMFANCTSLRISETAEPGYDDSFTIPTGGTGTDDSGTALTDMFKNTGGTFTGTPIINTTYYID